MKKQRVLILSLCCLLICGFAACGRNKNDENNNSVTDGNHDSVTTSPTNAPTVVPDNHQDDNRGVLDGVEDMGDGIIHGTEDVIDGVGDAVNDIGDGITGDNDRRHDDTGTTR